MASNSSPLLINESPLQVLPSLAKALGNVNEAIILQQIQYWLKNPKSGRVGEDGRKYIRDTYDEWQQQLTWLSTRTIKSKIKSLQNKGLLLTANLNKSKYDRTNWYSIDYDKLNELMQSEETSLSKVKKVTNEKGSNFTIKSEESYQPIPKTSSKSSTETSTKKYSSSAKQNEPPIPYQDIINYLNQKTGTHYKQSSKANRKLIKARWDEGYRLDDFKKVIDNKAFDWQNDSKMWKYMRPATLFSASKFDDYLNENDLNNTARNPASGGYDTAPVPDINGIPDQDLPF
ncbi:conserved phage C-terminal domain-containing protein [Lactobacillus amylolyticus]|uniref:conserved phage C-terminal domain-containing protein n=1 Tax=Lactobacillus amylolyticus TaxID=83683 RepID=UPI002491C159|nr:conserved phage C-terminal domain-containing protein [Lactobacillus amylolyticus]